MNSTVLSNVRYYQILGLKRTDATPEQIKRAYREMAVKTHPDRNQNDPDSTTKFQEVSQAYTILSSKRMRQVYDSYGEQGLKMYESYLSFAESDDGHKLPIGPVMMLLLACFGVSLLVRSLRLTTTATTPAPAALTRTNKHSATAAQLLRSRPGPTAPREAS